MLQMLTAFATSFVYLIALFYSIQDLDAVYDSSIGFFPTAEIYRQATGSNAGAIGLIAVLFLATFPTLIGTFVTGGRMWWSLARDNATPFASYFAQVHPTLDCPVRATVAMSALVTCLGCIYVGSTTAFQALYGQPNAAGQEEAHRTATLRCSCIASPCSLSEMSMLLPDDFTDSLDHSALVFSWRAKA